MTKHDRKRMLICRRLIKMAGKLETLNKQLRQLADVAATARQQELADRGSANGSWGWLASDYPASQVSRSLSHVREAVREAGGVIR